MATTGIINGTKFGIYQGATLIAHGTSGSISMSHSVRDATTKDSLAFSESLEGLREWSIDGEFMLAQDAAQGIDELNAIWVGRTVLTLRFSTETSGDNYWNGQANLTELSIDAPTEESTTFSASFQGTAGLNYTLLT